jgi:hypothetical protein
LPDQVKHPQRKTHSFIAKGATMLSCSSMMLSEINLLSKEKHTHSSPKELDCWSYFLGSLHDFGSTCVKYIKFTERFGLY